MQQFTSTEEIMLHLFPFSYRGSVTQNVKLDTSSSKQSSESAVQMDDQVLAVLEEWE